METEEILHILRNSYGKSAEELKAAQLAACDKIESLQAAYINMRDFANENGLDTATTGEVGDG